MRDTPIHTFMTTDVVTVEADAALDEAVRALIEAGHSGAPVLRGGRLVGLLDDSDLLLAESRLHLPTVVELFGAYLTLPSQVKRYEDELRHAVGGTVADVMDGSPKTLSPDDTVEDAATCLTESGQSRAAVVDADGRLVGLVSRSDLVRQLAV